MIKHIVTWKLKEEAEGNTKVENAKKIKEILEALDGKIETLKAIEVGINFNDSTQAYDVVLYSEFDTVEGLNIYQNHPEHVKAGTFIKAVVTDRIVVDYEV
ncbi:MULTISPECIES: Dabb family protein [Clostridium]|jgi:phenylalanyl-tRNA synthetase alpha subunit|uniref:Dabb n=2 Tax=Clostridium intestinale TaxID=36845 RepID=U2NJE9_9CLOT|nr:MULTISPECIES: Dabb family protein [Clostridium]ERK28986.1 dabb [Clostridium intestinale URNW]WRY50972.1 Dabb family protein [Clostridium intestinale]SHI46907.1 Stress responsive A/B Barrel Domain [Clostridium intestinale DSM 6191]